MAPPPELETLSKAFQLRQLRGVDGKHHSLDSLAGRIATAVVFTANGCPTARSYEARLIELERGWQAAGVHVVAVNSNNPHLSPSDTFDEMVTRARDHHFNFPYLEDLEGAMAKELGAICTPHAFLLDDKLTVVYRGRIDDSRLGDKITSRDLEKAVTDVVAKRPIAVDRTDPFGCSIVW